MKALIIGGGIAGAVTAMALQKAGIDSTIYEAYPRGAGNTGAFLTFAGNGMHALAAIDADQPVRAKGFDTPRLIFTSGTGKRLGEISNGGAVADGNVSQTIRRGDLYQALQSQAVERGTPVEYGKRLVDARTDRHSVTALFADGTSATGDILIGCDGLRSVTRRLIDPNAPAARYVPVLNTGGYSTGVRVPGDPGDFHMMFGKRCFFGYVNAPNGEVWWFANPPRRDEPESGELSAIESERWMQTLVELFADDAGPAIPIIEATTNRLAAWSTYDVPKVPLWHNDRMIIIGDAAHAASPSAGQGASMAIEDGVLLAKCLRDLPLPEALPAFTDLRRERVEAVVAAGARSASDKAAGPVARVIRDLMLPLVFRRMSTGKGREWMYGYRIDWDEPVTVPAKAA
ncbi:MAG TPA: FAD-dependent monooxygenase [Actinomycetota bacterium]|nr:FAD-dependent monooxygenase [Actinomycetota bacterium]